MMQGRYSPFEIDALEDDFEDILEDDIEEVIDLDDANNEDQVENSPKNLTLKDDAISIFLGHLSYKDVYYCSINKNGDLAATGGQDDKAFLWNVNTCEIIFDTGNSHNDSVVFAEFNYNDKYLATADLRGKIILWQMSDKTYVWKVDLWTDLMWIKWHHFSDILIASAKTGRIYTLNTRTDNFLCEILAQGIASNAGVIFPDGKHVAIGYENGMIQVIDLKSNAVLSTTPPDTQTRSFGHAGSIRALDCYMDNNLLISVSATNQTILSTAHNGKVICVLQDLDKDGDLDEDGDNLNHVECAAFCKDPTFPVAATGTIFSEVEGTIYIWDIPKKSLRHEIQNEGGVSKLVWTRTSIFFTAGLDGKLRCFDAKAGHCLRVFSGHKEALFDFAISSDYKKAITASDDSTARIFDISSVC